MILPDSTLNQLPTNDQLPDLHSPAADFQEFAAAVELVYLCLAHEAHAAVYLYAVIQHAHAGPARLQEHRGAAFLQFAPVETFPVLSV